MVIKIDKPIVGYRLKDAAAIAAEKKANEAVVVAAAAARKASADGKVVQMHEKLERPDMLRGSTYKVKTPVSDHAMYVTINDLVLNPGTEYETQRPFEIFINSKNLDHYQWIVALTRIMSAVFRKGGDVTFLVDELKAVFDPRGGYWQPGGKFMPSIIAELGHIIEIHLRYIGMLPAEQLDEHQRKLVEAKRRAFEESQKQTDAFADEVHATPKATVDKPQFPPGSQMCSKCSTVALVMMDGCMTCLSCGDSKCG